MKADPSPALDMCRPLPDEQHGRQGALFDQAAGQVLTGPWQEQHALPVQSGCDMSDCSYCQGLARMRRDANGKLGCWLRHKRSRTDLASMDAPESDGPTQLAVVLDAGPNKQPRVASMWDHALAEPSLVGAALDSLEAQPSSGVGDGKGSTTTSSTSSCSSYKGPAYRPWSWDAAWASRHDAPPSRLRQLAAFQRPEPAASQRQSADIVCAVEFEEHGWLVATAGVAKQVRVYSLSSYLENPDHPHWQQPIRVHRMPSKLSSLAWNPDQPGVVTVGDYDGEVSQIDLETGHMVAEVDGHAGRRVWSVSHSLLRPHLCASASEDGTVRLWGGPCLAQAAGVVAPHSGAPACGVQLSPFDENALAVASSDHNVYVYDLRWAQRPLLVLSGHGRAASYARFLGRGRLASASVDASLAVWDLPGHQQQQQQHQTTGGAGASWALAGAAGSAACGAPVVRPWRQFRGHRNSKNFVGLAVRPEEGLLACGSEGPTAETCCYQVSWDAPLARCALAPSTPVTGGEAGQGQGPFCSAVCWQPGEASGEGGTPLLAAAMSDGELRVLGLQALR